jgi:hypothetical protein
MFFFKACPKCRGDLYQEHDLYGAFLTCLQCGYIHDYLTRPPDQLSMNARHIVRGSLKWSTLWGTKHTLPR